MNSEIRGCEPHAASLTSRPPALRTGGGLGGGWGGAGVGAAGALGRPSEGSRYQPQTPSFLAALQTTTSLAIYLYSIK